MTWVLVAVGAWLLCAVVAALVIGRSVRIADQRAAERLAAERDALVPNVVFDPLHAPDESDAGIPAPADPAAVEEQDPPAPGAVPRPRAVGNCAPSTERDPSSRGAGRY